MAPVAVQDLIALADQPFGCQSSPFFSKNTDAQPFLFFFVLFGGPKAVRKLAK